MILEIQGHNFPGRFFRPEDEPYDNVHCGIQVGREPADLVPGDAPSAVWTTELTLVLGPDFRGPAVQGKRGERFVYLTWGQVYPSGIYHMFRRAKLMLADVADLIGDTEPARVIARVDLTDAKGGPRCARLKPPAIEFSTS